MGNVGTMNTGPFSKSLASEKKTFLDGSLSTTIYCPIRCYQILFFFKYKISYTIDAPQSFGKRLLSKIKESVRVELFSFDFTRKKISKLGNSMYM